MATETDEFLKAEDAVNELLANLERLKGEIGSYESARKSLEDTGDALRQITASLDQAARQANGVFELLQQIGTPEILNEIRRLSDASGRLATLSTDTSRHITSALSNTQSELSTSISQLGERIGSESSQLLSQFGALEQRISTEIAQLRRDSAGCEKGLHDAITEQRKWLTIIAICIWILGIATGIGVAIIWQRAT